MKTVNILAVYGAGNDAAFGGALRGLVAAIKQDAEQAGYSKQIYVPRIVDYLELATILRLTKQWRDDTIVLAHSCGCYSGTLATLEDSMSVYPYVACIAPSMFCSPRPVASNVRRLDQFTSNVFDVFNLGGRQLVSAANSNGKTEINVIKTGLPHLTAPSSRVVHATVIGQVRRAVGF